MRLTEPLAFKLVALFALIPLAGFLPLVLGPGQPMGQTPAPVWMNELVITAGSWPLDAGAPDLSAAFVAGLVERSTSIAYSYTPSTVSSVAAASMFTGLLPLMSGVQSAGQRLPAGTWTTAMGLAAEGSATAAFLEEPLISATGLEGFSTVEEDLEGAEVLATRVLQLWNTEVDRPSFVWVHFADAGPGGSKVGDFLRRLEQAPGGLDEARRAESLILMTAFASDGKLGLDNDSGFRVPLSLALPADLFGGLRSEGMASLVDVPQILIEVLGLPLPATRMDARPSIVDAFKGSAVYNWTLLEGPDGHVLRRGIRRLTAPGRPPAALEGVQAWTAQEVGCDAGFERAPDGPALYGKLLSQLLGPRPATD